ncbi:MAG: DUF167 domain-containing protein [Rhizobiales bacterium]|nr:DUF167 domain-containing protein [Hyphomicrobiales bacterium]
MVEKSGPLSAEGDATLLAIRLTPKGGKDALEPAKTLSDGRCVLAARVRAVPENGEANRALVALVARSLECPASAVQLVSGATSRLKILRVERAYQEVKARLTVLSLI